MHAKETDDLRPITCAHTIDNASHCVGLILPGIIEDPGSFAGRINSAIPLLGPDDKTRISFAILKSELVKISIADMTSINTSWDASASYLFGADLKGSFVIFCRFLMKFLEKSFGAFTPEPTAVPP